MDDMNLFNEVFGNIVAKNSGITMKGTFVYYRDELMFNTQDYSLGYNLHRLTNLMERVGEFL